MSYNTNYAYSTQGYGGPTVMQPAPSTTVVIQQPGAVKTGPVRDWNSGLCSCFDDMTICLCGLCCSLCLACQVAQDMGETPVLPCCVPTWLLVLRTKLRTQQQIQGSVCNDCLVTECCGICALCQLAREVKTLKETGQLNNVV